MLCPNRSCQYLQRYGTPAEWPGGTHSCAACGTRLEEERTAEAGEPEYSGLVVIAEFGETHEAHLAKGRLEAEGVMARVAGEHLASLNAMFSDTDGLIRLEVAPQDVERAVEILEQDHSGTISDEDVGVAPQPPATTVCPRCGSASVVEDEPRRGSIIGIILAALRGRRKQCFTCGHRF
jgi:hypothetical protein